MRLVYAALRTFRFHLRWRSVLSLPENPFDYDLALQGCARGDRRALQGLYEHEGGRLLAVAKRIVGDTALAEDIVHDAFVRIWTRAASFDPQRGSARGWLFSVTRHLALNHVRRHERLQPLADQDIDAMVADEPAGLAIGGARIDGCLEQLEPLRRQCLYHAYLDGYSHAEIAHKLDTPLGTVKAWIKRSLAALRECMA